MCRNDYIVKYEIFVKCLIAGNILFVIPQGIADKLYAKG